MRRAVEPRGKVPRLHYEMEAHYEKLYDEFCRYWPPEEMLRRLRELVSTLRKLAWMEFALKALADKYYKCMLLMSVAGGLTVEETADHVYGPGDGYIDYDRLRRDRLKTFVRMARSLRKANTKTMTATAMRKRATRLAAARRDRDARAGATSAPCETETFYVTVVTIVDVLGRAISAYGTKRTSAA